MSNARIPSTTGRALDGDGASARNDEMDTSRRSRTGTFAFMGDDIDRLGDDALLRYLTDAAAKSDMRLVIEERNGEWFAESRAPSGLGGEMVVLGAHGPSRRGAMFRLAQLFAGNH